MNFKQSNYLIDVIMPAVKPTTFKVISIIARKTWGWNCDEVELSLSQMQQLTGISSPNTIKAAVTEAATYIEQTPIENEQGYRYKMKPIPASAGTMSEFDTGVSEFDTEGGGTMSKNDTVLYQNLTGTISNFDPPIVNKESKKEKQKERGIPPTPFPTPTPALTPDRLALAEVVNALVDATGMDGHENWSILSREAAKFLSGNYTAEDIKTHYGRTLVSGRRWNWYTNDWRGKKGELPSIKFIWETISGARRWGHRNGQPARAYIPEHLRDIIKT